MKKGDIDRRDEDIEPGQKDNPSNDTSEEAVYEQDVKRDNIGNYRKSYRELLRQEKNDENNPDDGTKFFGKNFSMPHSYHPEYYREQGKKGKIQLLPLKIHDENISVRGCLIPLNHVNLRFYMPEADRLSLTARKETDLKWREESNFLPELTETYQQHNL